jgi:hypothetical protein
LREAKEVFELPHPRDSLGILRFGKYFENGKKAQPMGRKPERITLSTEALSLFRLHLERHGDLDAEANRAAYQELERAGLMAVGHSFRNGRNSIYRLTKVGFERNAELLACAKEAG